MDDDNKRRIIPLFPDQYVEPADEMEFEFDTPDLVTFSDVGGMEEFKRLAAVKIIQPFKNPELFRKYRKEAGGGVLLYGPPGCGKTYISKAIAGECAASFVNVSIDDVLDMYLGNSEKNVSRLFQKAREAAPSILFIDEIDALGQRRDNMRGSAGATVVNAFLSEMDGIKARNRDVLVVGATNAVWDVDTALKRPGRFDQVLFVPPPDVQARKEILDIHITDMPVSGVDSQQLAESTELFSGADLVEVINRASESVLLEIVESGLERDVTMKDMLKARKEVRPSTLEWLKISENYINFANDTGVYDELKEFMAGQGLLSKKKWFF